MTEEHLNQAKEDAKKAAFSAWEYLKSKTVEHWVFFAVGFFIGAVLF